MTGESDLTSRCRLHRIIAFLGGYPAPELQGFLLGRPVGEMTDQECENQRVPCVNAILSQVSFLQEPYDAGDFEDRETAFNWLLEMPEERRTIVLAPISHPDVVIHVSGVGNLTRH